MRTYNIHDVKARLSWLVEQAAQGESFVIAKSGKPMVKVDSPQPSQVKRFGFLAGQISVPREFDRIGEVQIAAMFGAGA